MKLLQISEYRENNQTYAAHTLLKFKGNAVEFRWFRRELRKLPCRYLVVTDPYTFYPINHINSDAMMKMHSRQVAAEHRKRVKEQAYHIFGVRIFDLKENFQLEKYRDFKHWLVILKLAS